MSKIFYVLSFLLILVLTQSCEVDDICTETVLTPKLIVTFHDATNRDTRKEVDTLTVWVTSKNKRYDKIKTDSIAIPLDMNSNVVNYNFVSSSIIDTLQVHYDKKDIFVSRSCGYKINFTLLNDTHFTHNWATDYEIITPNIENEQNVHIQIYH